MPLFSIAIDLPGWAILVKDLGFPIAVAIILLGIVATVLFFCLKAVRWFGNQIVIPLRDAHTNFLSGLEHSQIKQASTLEGVKNTLERLTSLQEQHSTETSYIRLLLEGKNSKP